MKNLILAAITLASLAAASCKERKDDPRPDYEGARGKSESSHKSLDKEAAGHGDE